MTQTLTTKPFIIVNIFCKMEKGIKYFDCLEEELEILMRFQLSRGIYSPPKPLQKMAKKRYLPQLTGKSSLGV